MRQHSENTANTVICILSHSHTSQGRNETWIMYHLKISTPVEIKTSSAWSIEFISHNFKIKCRFSWLHLCVWPFQCIVQRSVAYLNCILFSKINFLSLHRNTICLERRAFDLLTTHATDWYTVEVNWGPRTNVFITDRAHPWTGNLLRFHLQHNIPTCCSNRTYD